jgi:hypothetical protein
VAGLSWPLILMTKGELTLTCVGVALQLCVIVLLLSRRLYWDFWFFFFYLLFAAFSTIVNLAVRNNPLYYFYSYWISEALGILLTFLAIQEAFRSVFRNFYNLRWFKLSFPTIGILIAIIALLRAVFFRPSNHSPLAVAIISLEIAVGFLQFGIFCLFIGLVRFFHMRWRQHAFGIVLGFGISAAGSLVTFLLRSEFGTILNRLVRTAIPVTYIIGVAVWVVTFLRAEPPPEATKAPALTPEQMIAELRRHTKAVKGILGR